MLGCAYELPARSRSRAGGGGGELSDALRHVQRSQHLFKDGALHVGAPQVRLLQVAPGQVAVLHKPESLVGFLRLPKRCTVGEESGLLESATFKSGSDEDALTKVWWFPHLQVGAC